MFGDSLFLRYDNNNNVTACTLVFIRVDKKEKTKSFSKAKKWIKKGIPFCAKGEFIDDKRRVFETTDIEKIEDNKFYTRSGTKYEKVGIVKFDK